MSTTARLSAIFLSVALLLSACGAGGGGRATPDAALQALQAGLLDDDADRVLDLLDGDSRAYYRQEVRTARARRVAGEEPPPGVSDPQLANQVYHEGSLDEAAAQLALRSPPLGTFRGWLSACTVQERSIVREDDGRQLATLRVRAPDGAEHDVFMIHELDGWAFDAYRHFQESMAQR